MFSMEQLNAALDSRPANVCSYNGEREERRKKKEGDDDEHLDEDVAPKDGQNKDATCGEEKDSSW